MVPKETFEVRQEDQRRRLLPRLRGRVFHVTTAAALPSILESGKVSWDYGKPQYSNAYFRSRGCVSVCDLRTVDDRELGVGLDAYTFLDPFWPPDDPAFLFLAEGGHLSLIPGREQMENRDLDKLIAPYIEAGFKGDLPATYLDGILIAHIERGPPDPFVQAHLEAYKSRMAE